MFAAAAVAYAAPRETGDPRPLPDDEPAFPGMGDVGPQEIEIELEAYFADGPFLPAQRLVARGETRAAVLLLRKLLKSRPSAPERPQAQYLLGLSLLKLREFEEAAELFLELAKTYAVLKDDHLFFRGQALFLWGSYLKAAEVLSDVESGGARGAEARRLRASALLRATDFEGLARWLEGLQKNEGTLEPELVYMLGRARHRSGDALGAYRAFREVWRDAPGGKLAGPALAHIAELRVAGKSMLTKGELSAIHSVEEQLKKASDGDATDRAMTLLEKKLDRSRESPALKAEIAYVRGRIAQAKGRFKKAEAHYARATDRANQSRGVDMIELRARIALEEARLAQRLGDEVRALDIYKTVAKTFSERPEAEEALFQSGEILLGSRRYEEARGQFEGLLIKNPVTVYRPYCLWGIGWSYYRHGQRERANEFFLALSRIPMSSDLAAANLYWLARTEASLGRFPPARDLYRKITMDFPLSYYAALAEDQLAEDVALTKDDAQPGGTAQAEDAATPGLAEAEDAEPVKELVEIQEYTRLGLRARALSALARYEAKLRKRSRRVEEAKLRSLARLYDDLSHGTNARRIREECTREYGRTLFGEEFLAEARRAHPIRFEKQIRSAASEFDISPGVLFALIRTESNFRPEVVSGMDALGLAQLILTTAQQISKRIRGGSVTRQRLIRDPAFNVRLGAAYLRSLLDRFHGSEPLALASYNAGPTAVTRWLARRIKKLDGKGTGKGDAGALQGVSSRPAPDELAEEIPVAETRAFVKTVLARARGYSRLY